MREIKQYDVALFCLMAARARAVIKDGGNQHTARKSEQAEQSIPLKEEDSHKKPASSQIKEYTNESKQAHCVHPCSLSHPLFTIREMQELRFGGQY